MIQMCNQSNETVSEPQMIVIDELQMPHLFRSFPAYPKRDSIETRPIKISTTGVRCHEL